MSKRNLHIFHLITTISPGGAENQLLTLCKELTERGTKQSIAYMKGLGELRPRFESLGITCFKMDEIREISAFVFHLLKAKARGMVLIHAHLPRAELLALVFSTFLRINLLVTKHNMEKFWPKGPDQISNLLAKLVERRSKRIICISNSVREFLVQNKEVSNRGKYSVIYYGRAKKRDDRSAGVEERGPRKSLHRIISISRLEEQKDLSTQFRAIKTLTVKIPDISLVIIGEGSKRKDLESEIAEMELVNKVRLVGKVENVDLELRKSSIFVLSSLYEGFGLAILEAIDAEIPILVSDSTAALEILDNQYDLLFPLGDSAKLATKIVALFENSEARYQNINLSKKVTAKFSISETAENHLRLYRHVVKS